MSASRLICLGCGAFLTLLLWASLFAASDSAAAPQPQSLSLHDSLYNADSADHLEGLQLGASVPLTTPTPYITPTPLGTYTPTPTTGCCQNGVTATITGFCQGSDYGYTYNINNTCNFTVTANGGLFFEVSPNQNGPWTSPIHIDYFGANFGPGNTQDTGAIWFGPLPPGNNWWRTHLYLNDTRGCWAINVASTAVPACVQSTPTSTPTATQVSATQTPIITPSATTTPVGGQPNLYGSLFWQTSCPAPTLRLATYLSYIQGGQVPDTVMRLQNSAGDFLDFNVPPLTGGPNAHYAVNCMVGDCIPSSWLQSLPYTLTVDYTSTVAETNEVDNISTLNTPPPAPCATPISTSTSITSSPTSTSTAPTVSPTVADPNPPDLVPQLEWLENACPDNILRVTTRNQYPELFYNQSTMVLRNSAGETLQWSVPAPVYPQHSVDCPVGSCLPTSWLNARPFTLTVDYYNNVYEASETNNTLIWNTPPPQCPQCTLEFTDVPSTHTFYPFVRCLACRDILGGYSDGTFRPGNDVTRGQIAKIVSNSAGYTEEAGEQIYEDVLPDNTFFVWVNRLSNRGHIGGYPCGQTSQEPCLAPGNRSYFRPNAPATRGQIAKIVSNAAGFSEPVSDQVFEDVPITNTFHLYVGRLVSRSILGGYPCGTRPDEPCVAPADRPYFRPGANTTRGQVSKIVANTFFPFCSTP